MDLVRFVFPGEDLLRPAEDLARSLVEADEVEEVEIVQLVRAEDLFGLVAGFAGEGAVRIWMLPIAS